MSLRSALLGFLTTEPASGYRLAQEFSESMGWFWHASHSQIHPELKRMEAEGLVSSAPSNGDGRGTRIFSITGAGRAELDRWLAEDTEYPPVRDVERIKLVFLDQHPPEASDGLDPAATIRAPAAYKLHLTRVLTRRALEEAGRA